MPQSKSLQSSLVLLFAMCMFGCSDGNATGPGIVSSVAPATSISSVTGEDKGGSCSSGEDVGRYLGNYHVFSVERMTGGLTSEAKARSKSSAPVVLSTAIYKSGWLDKGIRNPRYVISCYPVPAGEGEVPVVTWNAHWTNFYGFGTNRRVIKVLEVHDPADADKSPYTWFEVVDVDGNEQLWQQHDGWLLRMTRAH